MKSKNTYKPKSSPSYKKGGKSSYKDKKIKRGDKTHYQDPLTTSLNLLGDLIGDFGTLSAISAQQAELDELTPNLFFNLTQALGDSPTSYYNQFLADAAPTGASGQLSEFAADIPGLVKPIKPTSTEFLENMQDIQERRTGTTITEMGKTGIPSGTKAILDAAAEGDIKTQSKVADLKMQEQKMEQERDKYLASLTGQTLTSISQQDLTADTSAFNVQSDIFGGVTSAYGDLMSSIIAGQVALAGTQEQAMADMIAGVIQGIGEIIPGEKV